MRKLVIFIMFSSALAVLVSIFLFISHFGFGFSNKISNWTDTATFFSNILTPFLSLISIILLLSTLRINIESINQSRQVIEQSEKQLAKSDFESSFYSYMRFLSEMVDKLEISESENIDYLHHFKLNEKDLNDFMSEMSVDSRGAINFKPARGNDVFKSISHTICTVINTSEDPDLCKITSTVIEMDGRICKIYLDFLCSILTFLDASNLPMSKTIHLNIVKSQINLYEKTFLFLALFSEDYKDSDLKYFVNRYALLEGLTYIGDGDECNIVTPFQIGINDQSLANFVYHDGIDIYSAFGNSTPLGKISISKFINESKTI